MRQPNHEPAVDGAAASRSAPEAAEHHHEPTQEASSSIRPIPLDVRRSVARNAGGSKGSAKGVLGELLQEWRAKPDVETTISLCSFLSASKHDARTIHEVGMLTQQRFRDNPDALLAVARMYLAAGRLHDAERILGKLADSEEGDPRPLQYLGQIKLRRGHAREAESLLESALACGAGEETRQWLDRARACLELERTAGALAVADSVRAAAAHSEPSASPATVRTVARVPRPSARPESSKASEAEAITLPPEAATLPPEERPTDRPGTVHHSTLPQTKAEATGRAKLPRSVLVPVGAPTTRGSSPSRPSSTLSPSASGSSAPPSASARPEPGPEEPTVVMKASELRAMVASERPREEVTRVMSGGSLKHYRRKSSASRSKGTAGRRDVSADEPTRVMNLGADSAPDEPTRIMKRAGDDDVDEPTRVMHHDGMVPDEVTVTQMPLSGPTGLTFQVPKLERVIRGQRRRTLVRWFGGIAFLLCAASVGAWVWRFHARTTAHAAVEDHVRGVAQVKALLASGTPRDLDRAGTELRLLKAAAGDKVVSELALVHGALGAVFGDTTTKQLRSVLDSAKAAGLTTRQTAPAEVVLPLVEGNVSGALAAVKRADETALDDPYYLLLSGVVLERNADGAALDRYRKAAALAPDLFLAHLQAARLVLLNSGPKEAVSSMVALERLHSGSLEARTLRELSSALGGRDAGTQNRGRPAARELRSALPRTLRALPPMVDAVRAIKSGSLDGAGASIETALKQSNDPFVFGRLGTLALAARDPSRVGEIAAAFERISQPGRAALLRAREALLEGRFADTNRLLSKAGSDPDAALVRAMVAYETWDQHGLEDALRALQVGVEGAREFGVLAATANVLTRAIDSSEPQLKALEHSDIPWAELLVVDAAMNSGNLDAAKSRVSRWPAERLRAPELLRAARLARYQGRTKAALAATERALSMGKPTAALVVERVYELLDAGQNAVARTLVSRHAGVFGTRAVQWVGALVDSYAEAPDERRVRGLSTPAVTEPLGVRTLAARALARFGDPRARHYVGQLEKLAPRHPDVRAAVATLSAR